MERAKKGQAPYRRLALVEAEAAAPQSCTNSLAECDASEESVIVATAAYIRIACAPTGPAKKAKWVLRGIIHSAHPPLARFLPSRDVERIRLNLRFSGDRRGTHRPGIRPARGFYQRTCP